MRDQLLGYLLGALDPDEYAQVERQLTLNPGLREDLERLRQSLEVLQSDVEQFEPPPGLAERCCDYVFDQSRVQPAGAHPQERGAGSNRWSFADFAVAAGIAIAASALFLPALNQSRASAKVSICQNNLRQLGNGLTQYSERNGGQFPKIEANGPLNSAGVWAVVLRTNEYLPDERMVLCPDSLQALEKHFVVPSVNDMLKLGERDVERMQKTMGGSYAYHIGYIKDGKLQPFKNLRRKSFALLGDAPSSDCSRGANHWQCGSNVLFEDGRVVFRRNCRSEENGDNFYLNDRNELAPGLHVNDSVLGASFVRPKLLSLVSD